MGGFSPPSPHSTYALVLLCIQYLQFLSVTHQVDRKVVNNLALAFEQGHITKGCCVRLSVRGGRPEEDEGEGSAIKLLVTTQPSKEE